MPLLVWQFKSSIQIPDRNFQLLMKKGPMTGSWHTDVHGPAAPFPASRLALETSRSLITLEKKYNLQNHE